MEVPKAAVDEYDLASRREYEVGPSWQVGSV